MGTRFVTKVMIFETSVEDLATSEKHLGLPRCPEPCQLTKLVSFSNGMQKFLCQFYNMFLKVNSPNTGIYNTKCSPAACPLWPRVDGRLYQHRQNPYIASSALGKNRAWVHSCTLDLAHVQEILKKKPSWEGYYS